MVARDDFKAAVAKAAERSSESRVAAVAELVSAAADESEKEAHWVANALVGALIAAPRPARKNGELMCLSVAHTINQSIDRSINQSKSRTNALAVLYCIDAVIFKIVSARLLLPLRLPL